MTTTIDIHELPNQFAELIARAGAGGDIVVTERGLPKAVLRPLPAASERRAGLHAGVIQATPDFDAPLPDEFWTEQP